MEDDNAGRMNQQGTSVGEEMDAPGTAVGAAARRRGEEGGGQTKGKGRN